MSDPYSKDADRAQRLGRPMQRLMRQWQRFVQRRPWLRAVYKVVITVLGAIVVIVGLILLPLPGPGWLVVFIGLSILGTEYHWARRVLGWLRRVLARFWERWHSWRERREPRE
jgi:uncharacterized protein (TIGR02611 family)